MQSRRRAVVALAVVSVVGLAGCSSNQGVDRAAESAKAFDAQSLDTAIKPCVDFNDFVNKKWVDSTKIPADRSSYGVFDELQDKSDDTQKDIAETAARDLNSLDTDSDKWKIGTLYQSAMDEKTINARGYDPIKSELAKVDALASPQDVKKFLDEDAVDGGSLVFGIGPGADFKDATKQIAYVGSTGVSLPSKDYYTDPQHANIAAGYQTYMQSLLKLVGTAEPAAQAQAGQAFDFEKELAATTFSPEEARKPENQYHVISVDEADKITPEFDWRHFLDIQNLKSTDSFSMSETAYFAKVNDLLQHAPIDQWKSFLRTHVIMRSAPLLSQQFRDARFEFNKLLSGATSQPPRWRVALSAVNSSMGMAMGKVYSDKVFTADAKDRAEALVHNVLDALKARIEHVTWMTPETKQKALDKWAAIVPRIGYPDKWRDWSGLKLTSGDFYGNEKAADKFNNDYELARIGKPTDRSRWSMTPQTVNAYYSPSDNTINFPAAILQAPFFDANADDALNYGGIGSIIGHESTHAFDDQGSQFDGKGNNVDWWTKTDAEQFQTRADKLVQQFNSYVPFADKPDVHVNGQLTLGENIADLGGVLAAYDAFEKTGPSAEQKIDGYTPDQQFFVAYARSKRSKTREEALLTQISSDPHSPDPLRTNGVVPNVPAFAQAYHCAPTDPMVNSGDKLVTIW